MEAFKTGMDGRIAASMQEDAKLRSDMQGLMTQLTARFTEIDAVIDGLVQHLQAKFLEVEASIAATAMLTAATRIYVPSTPAEKYSALPWP